jgi:branched-chain amino acid transport system permease protein
MSTIFYDSGFLIGLKGFVAATIGALASFPAAAGRAAGGLAGILQFLLGQ